MTEHILELAGVTERQQQQKRREKMRVIKAAAPCSVIVLRL